MMSFVMPGTSARAAAPTGSAAMSAGTDDAGKPAASAAAGTRFSIDWLCAFIRMVVYTEMATAPPAKRATPLENKHHVSHDSNYCIFRFGEIKHIPNS